MYVCNCNGLTERQVRKAIDDGARTWMDVHLYHGVRPQCGRCGIDISDRLKRTRAPSREPGPGLPGLAEAT